VPEIRYQFVSSGAREVVDNFRSIESAAKASTGAVRELDRALRLRAPSGGGGGGGGGGRRGASEQERLAQRVATDQERAARRASQAQEREAAHAVAAANRSGKEQERAHARAAQAAERASDRAVAAKKREEDRKWREVERTAARIQREDARAAASSARAAARDAKAHRRMVGHAGSAIIGGAGRLLGMGGDLVGGAVRESLVTQGIAQRVSISSRKAGQDFADPTKLRKEFEGAALANPGVSAEQVGEAAKAYIELTGDLNTARASLGTFATVASATGADIKDVATAAASLGDKFDVKKPEEMRQVLAALAFQGKEGAIELKDVATQFQRLAAAGSSFGLPKGAEGVAKLGGFLQVARQGTGNARSAATAVENVFAAFSKKGAVHGLYDKSGKKKEFNHLVADEIAYLGGSDVASKEKALTKKFGAQGMRAINPLFAAYRDAAAGKKGKEAQEAGRAKVLDVLEEMTRAGAAWSEIEKDAAKAQEMSSAKLAAAWEQLKAAAGDKLAPTLATLATKLAEGGIDPLITTVQALGEAATLAIDGLKFIGLIKPKGEPTAAQKLDTAKKALDDYEKGMAAGPATVETAAQAAKHAALRQAVDDADKDAWQPLEKGLGTMTPKAFAERYAALSGATGDDLTERKDAAEVLGSKLKNGKPGEFMYDMAVSNTEYFGDENAAQKRLRENYMSGTANERKQNEQAGATAFTDEAAVAQSAAAKELSASAKEILAAAQKLGSANRPTVAGGTK
jgi:hypothetical protein